MDLTLLVLFSQYKKREKKYSEHAFWDMHDVLNKKPSDIVNVAAYSSRFGYAIWLSQM